MKPFLIWALMTLVIAPASGATSSTLLRVGLYAEPKVTYPPSVDGVESTLRNADMVVEKISSQTLQSADLSVYDVIVFPGGTANGEARSLGTNGGQRVTEFAKQGGGVIGICAGAWLVAEGWSTATRSIDVINAAAFDDKHWPRGEGRLAVQVLPAGAAAANTTTSTLDSERQLKPTDTASSRTIYFMNGPLFVPGGIADLPAYTPLVRYVDDWTTSGSLHGLMAGRDAVVAAPYGKGRAVAFGPHPELTPELRGWLTTAVQWAAGQRGQNMPITVDTVLEPK